MNMEEDYEGNKGGDIHFACVVVMKEREGESEIPAYNMSIIYLAVVRSSIILDLMDGLPDGLW